MNLESIHESRLNKVLENWMVFGGGIYSLLIPTTKMCIVSG